jgi:hypothetical protein
MSDHVISKEDTEQFVRTLDGQPTESIARMRRLMEALEGLTPEQAEERLNYWWGQESLSRLDEAVEDVTLAMEQRDAVSAFGVEDDD